MYMYMHVGTSHVRHTVYTCTVYMYHILGKVATEFKFVHYTPPTKYVYMYVSHVLVVVYHGYSTYQVSVSLALVDGIFYLLCWLAATSICLNVIIIPCGVIQDTQNQTQLYRVQG